MGMLQSDLESLAKNTEINFIEIDGVKQTCEEFSDKLNKVKEDVIVLGGALVSSIGDVEEEVGLLMWAVSNTSRLEDGPSKVKVPKPKGYNGAQNANELENFL